MENSGLNLFTAENKGSHFFYLENAQQSHLSLPLGVVLNPKHSPN